MLVLGNWRSMTQETVQGSATSPQDFANICADTANWVAPDGTDVFLGSFLTFGRFRFCRSAQKRALGDVLKVQNTCFE
jgi:hypothetical protein